LPHVGGPSEAKDWQAVAGRPRAVSNFRWLHRVSGPSEAKGWQAVGVGPHGKPE